MTAGATTTTHVRRYPTRARFSSIVDPSPERGWQKDDGTRDRFKRLDRKRVFWLRIDGREIRDIIVGNDYLMVKAPLGELDPMWVSEMLLDLELAGIEPRFE